MNIDIKSFPSELVYQACSVGNYDECILLIESENCDLNKNHLDRDSLLKTTLRGFVNNYVMENNHNKSLI